jgi:hypothetical protein
MKISNQLSIATLVLAGVFATGCSQQQVSGGSQSYGGSQQQVEGGSQVAGGGSQQMGSQQQVEAPAPVVVEEVVVVEPVTPAPAPVDRWAHTHPAVPNCTNSVTHSHKYSNARHTHHYGCNRPAMKKQPTVDVRALQQKLKAKGYYKGPIDGVVGPSTRSALQRFMQR